MCDRDKIIKKLESSLVAYKKKTRKALLTKLYKNSKKYQQENF